MAKKSASGDWFSVRSAFEKELAKNAKGLTKASAQILVNASNKFVQSVHEMSTLPYYTGNLRDSIAAAVATSGRVVRASYLEPPYQAVDPNWRPQHTTTRKRIIGTEEAVKAVRAYPYPNGVSAVLFVGVPYAQDVNDGVRGNSEGNRGYLDRLNEQFAADMTFAMQALKDVPIIAGEIIGRWNPLSNYPSRADINELASNR